MEEDVSLSLTLAAAPGVVVPAGFLTGVPLATPVESRAAAGALSVDEDGSEDEAGGDLSSEAAAAAAGDGGMFSTSSAIFDACTCLRCRCRCDARGYLVVLRRRKGGGERRRRLRLALVETNRASLESKRCVALRCVALGLLGHEDRGRAGASQAKSSVGLVQAGHHALLHAFSSSSSCE